ncbi:hypothetical protein Leryth_027314 [Lithospermum erythrorhizon]|nr:hypothetical protein Leryth_027314 [Lithospermum erythrorhizon]
MDVGFGTGNSTSTDKPMAGGVVDFFSDRKSDHSHDDRTIMKNEISAPNMDVNTGLQLVTVNTGSDQSTVDDSISSDVEDKRMKDGLTKLQMELEHMHTENQKLRRMLTDITNNYHALQMHLLNLMELQDTPKNETIPNQHEVISWRDKEPSEVLFKTILSLGHSSEDRTTNSTSEERTLSAGGDEELIDRGGKSPESKSWTPNKIAKFNNNNNNSPSSNKGIVDHQDSSSEAIMRKARVSVRARSEAPMISDGCQWRKYGQKMAKGNPCPRAYYRCTMAVGCPVRKQVQRCAEDQTILTTTYEGSHNHPLPPAAMAMASTTSAAASMLLSGSMPSADGFMNPNFLARTVLPCSSSMATISASAPFPTITLDLTQSTNNPLQFQRPPPTQFPFPFPTTPQSFANSSQMLSQTLHNQSRFSGLQLSQGIIEADPNNASFAETLSAATAAAITADPNFTVALAAAISSIIGGAQPSATNNFTSSPSTNNNTGNVSNNTTNKGSLPGI